MINRIAVLFFCVVTGLTLLCLAISVPALIQAYRDIAPSEYKYSVNQGTQLSEQLAIEYSKKALAAHGIEIKAAKILKNSYIYGKDTSSDFGIHVMGSNQEQEGVVHWYTKEE